MRTLVSCWFLALLFNPQHGSKMFPRNVYNLYQTTLRHISEGCAYRD
jgi:hypothetical protein